METPATLGVVTTDRGLVIRGWNEWLTEATGKSEAGVVGRPLTDFVSTGRAAFYRDLLTDVIESGSPRVLAPAFHHFLIECAPRAPSEHFDRMQQRVTVAPLRNDAEVVGVLITLEDVTARLDRERSLGERLQSAAPPPVVAVTDSLGSDDWQLRRHAVHHLKRAASVEDVRHLLATIERDHHDLNVLNSALRVLVGAGRSVIEPLLALLRGGEPNVRMHAALALGELRAPDAVGGLIAALDDDNDNVRFHAIEALGRIGAPEAVDSLARIASSGNFFLAFAAVDALGRTDDSRVAPLVASLLRDQQLHPAAVTTLAAIGDEDSVTALCEVLDEAGEAAAIAAALVAIHRRYEDTLKAGNVVVAIVRDAITDAGAGRLATTVRTASTDRRAAARVLSWLGRRALPVLAEHVGDPELDAVVCAAVVEAGRDAITQVLPLLQRDQPAARRSAAALLGQLGDGRAVAPLVAAFDDVDDSVVAAAVGAVAALDDRSTIEPLFGLLGHPGATVRHAAVAAINGMGAAGTAPLCGEALADSRPPVREAAVRIAGYFGFPEHLAAIIAALADEVEDVRRAAIEQLPIVDDPQAVARLIAALTSESPRNRAAAAHAMRLVDDRRAAAALTQALSDADPWVRYFSAASLSAHRGATGAAPRLAALAMDDTANHVRIAAVTALGSVDESAAIRLADRLLDDPDDDVAAAAITALASIPLPEASERLARAAQSSRPSSQIAAIRAVAQRPAIESVELLAWAARTGGPAVVQQDAIAGLCRIIEMPTRPAVRRGAIDALRELALEPVCRDVVLGAIGALGDDAVPDVASGLSASRVPARLATVDALAAMRNPRASQELARALRDESPAVRAAAVLAFGKLGTPSVGRTIAMMRRTDEDANVRHRAAQACERHRWHAGVVPRA